MMIAQQQPAHVSNTNTSYLSVTFWNLIAVLPLSVCPPAACMHPYIMHAQSYALCVCAVWCVCVVRFELRVVGFNCGI